MRAHHTTSSPARISRVQRLADFFRTSPGRWHDARVLFPIAGAYGWRSRVSDLRRPPFNLTIENRQRTVRQPDGTLSYVVSEYRLVPPTPEPAPTWELTPP